jgi:CRP-like cAMP-binding protein
VEGLVKQIIISFDEILYPERLRKGEVVHQSNTKGNKIFIVKSGLLRSYYYHNGIDVTAYFAPRNHLIGAVDSLLKKKQSIYTIEALEDSEILIMDYNQMESFIGLNPTYERMARQVTQFLYLDLVERFEGMMFLTAKERYDHLMIRYPNITQQVNLGHIASYLGITQETLSRIRRSN